MPKDPICGMEVSESTNLKVEKDSKTYYFCSRHCLEKFIQQEHIEYKKPETETCPTCEVHANKWYKNKTFTVTAILVFLVILSYFFNFLKPFRMSLWMYFKTIWWAVFLGLILGGIIDYFIPREYISKILSKPKKRTIFYSVFLGFLMSACSHGILALTIQLYKKGASTPAVVSFLLASPWANLPLTLIMFGFFGFKAFFIIISAIIIAVITGLLFQLLDSRSLIEKNPYTVAVKEDFSIIGDMKERTAAYKFSFARTVKDIKGIIDGSIALSDMVLWWILIGMGLASLAAAYIPQNVFQQYMGPTLLGICITLFVATILEVCSEGTAPLAFEIFRQTGALGNSFVFLMAGVVTDYTEIGLLWANIGRKTAIWMPLITVPQVILLGILANFLF
ncbi:MAG: permease [Endomicrobiales bacterium]|nr:permease [Endomicrobiales bacterium]